jgi:hypothetical protein
MTLPLANARHALWLFFLGAAQRAPMFCIGNWHFEQVVEDMPHFGTGHISTLATWRQAIQQ